jgi:anti-sigma factor RsiW
MTADQHLLPDTVALILDGRLGPADRKEATAHLAGCLVCRSELAAVDRVLQTAPARRWRTAGWLAVAAAAILAVAVPRLSLRGPSDDVDLERGAPAEGVAALPAYPPVAPFGRVEGLAWGSAGVGTTYQLTVVDRVGSLIWQTETEDTTMRFPATVHLSSQEPVFWSVDALLRDGSLRTTGPVALHGAR